MTSYKELAVWQRAMDVAVAVYALAESFPDVERFGLRNQVCRAAVSVPSNIAEGFGRSSHIDFAHFLAQARGSLCEVGTQLELAVRLGYIEPQVDLCESMTVLSRQLTVFIRRLRETSTSTSTSTGD